MLRNASSLFTASSAANAIPVAGQFVSAGLAIAGLFTKIFAGKRKEKKERAGREHRERLDKAKALSEKGDMAGAAAVIGAIQGAVSRVDRRDEPVAGQLDERVHALGIGLRHAEADLAVGAVAVVEAGHQQDVVVRVAEAVQLVPSQSQVSA